MALDKIKVNDTTTVNTGVVYDITTATSQTYDSLSAALGTNGNNVPSEVREGGMTVRFVHTSDNKYVQYRLMTTYFSATESNWQGVDDEAVENSHNLIESGGVYNTTKEFNRNRYNLKLQNNAYLIVAIPLGVGTELRYKVVSGGNVITTSNSYLQPANRPLGSDTQVPYRSLGMVTATERVVTITEQDVANGLNYLMLYFNRVSEQTDAVIQVDIIPWYIKAKIQPIEQFINHDVKAFSILNSKSEQIIIDTISSPFTCTLKKGRFTIFNSQSARAIVDETNDSDIVTECIGISTLSGSFMLVWDIASKKPYIVSYSGWNDFIAQATSGYYCLGIGTLNSANSFITYGYVKIKTYETDSDSFSSGLKSYFYNSTFKSKDYILCEIGTLPLNSKIKFVVNGTWNTATAYFVNKDTHTSSEAEYRYFGKIMDGVEISSAISQSDLTKKLNAIKIYFNDIPENQEIRAKISVFDAYSQSTVIAQSDKDDDLLSTVNLSKSIAQSSINSRLVQTTGNSTTDFMSQDAVTRAIQEASGDTPENRYADRPVSGYENFLVDVDVSIANNDNNTLDLQVIQNIKKDRGVICLPVNYSKRGNPVRLVILSYGTGGKITSETTAPVNTAPLSDALLAEGYAVLMMNGTPGDTEGTTIGSNGTPESIRSILAGYKYITNKYNIYTDGVFVSGYSQGSLCALQIALIGSIKVIAACMYGPDLDMWKQEFTLKGSDIRKRMCEKFGFSVKKANRHVAKIFNQYTEGITDIPVPTFTNTIPPTVEEQAYIINNIEKWAGYNPMTFGLCNTEISDVYSVWNATNSDTDEEYNLYKQKNIQFPVPTKLFVADDDTTTPYKYVKYIKSMAENAGKYMEVRRTISGSHRYPWSTNNVTVTTKYGGDIQTKVNTWEGILFFNSFNK